MSADLIEEIRRQMIERELFPEHYRRERIKLLISGDVRPDDLEQKFRQGQGMPVQNRTEVANTCDAGSNSQ